MRRPGLLFALNTALFSLFMALWLVPITGLTGHELLGFAAVAVIVVHVVVQWNWLGTAFDRFLKPRGWRLRANLLVNVLLFVTAVVVIWSGLAISDIAHKALRSVGIVLPSRTAWVEVHGISQSALSLLVGMHIAINWRWIVGVAVRLNPLPLHHRRNEHIRARHDAQEGHG